MHKSARMNKDTETKKEKRIYELKLNAIVISSNCEIQFRNYGNETLSRIYIFSPFFLYSSFSIFEQHNLNKNSLTHQEEIELKILCPTCDKIGFEGKFERKREMVGQCT